MTHASKNPVGRPPEVVEPVTIHLRLSLSQKQKAARIGKTAQRGIRMLIDQFNEDEKK
jgi:hypothetical protein